MSFSTPPKPPRPTTSSTSTIQIQQSQTSSEHESRLQLELAQLLSDIRRIGPTYPSPAPRCTFGELFDDPQVEQYYEALVGTLKSAKRRGLVRYEGQMLLKGMSDKVVIGINGESPPPKMKLRDGVLEKGGSKSNGGDGDKDDTADALGTAGKKWSPKSSPVRPASTLVGLVAGSSPGRSQSSPTLRGGSAGRGGSPSPPSSGPAGLSMPALPLAGNATMTRRTLLGAASASSAAAAAANKSSSSSSASSAKGSRPGLGRMNSLPALSTTHPYHRSTSNPSAAGSSSAKSNYKSPTSTTATAGLVFRSNKSANNSAAVSASVAARVEAEISRLPSDVVRIGSGQYAPPVPRCTFGDLFDDDEVQNHYEALVGTLKSAKKRGIVKFEGQMLLKGMSDRVVIEVVNVPNKHPNKESGVGAVAAGGGSKQQDEKATAAAVKTDDCKKKKEEEEEKGGTAKQEQKLAAGTKQEDDPKEEDTAAAIREGGAQGNEKEEKEKKGGKPNEEEAVESITTDLEEATIGKDGKIERDGSDDGNTSDNKSSSPAGGGGEKKKGKPTGAGGEVTQEV